MKQLEQLRQPQEVDGVVLRRWQVTAQTSQQHSVPPVGRPFKPGSGFLATPGDFVARFGRSWP